MSEEVREIAMLELKAVFTRTGGGSQPVTIRIGDVRETHAGTDNPWSAAVEIIGFMNPPVYRIRGRDWAESIGDAARFAAIRVTDMMETAGGGTLEPPLLPRPISPGDGS